MDRRSHEAPMDFEYQNGTGPMDMRSPFSQLSGNQRFFGSQAEDNNNTRKRMGTRSTFGSPSKPSSPIKSFGPNTPFSSFKSGPVFSAAAADDVDISMSDAGTPKSPEQSSIMDSDATPDNNAFRTMPATFDPKPSLFGNISPTKAKDRSLEKARSPDKRRDSWWSRAAGLVSSPGRDEMPRAVQPNDKLITKVQKKKRGESLRQLMKLRSNSISDSEISQSPSPSKSKKRSRWGRRTPEEQVEQKPEKGRLASFFEFISAHPDLPNILSRYTQYALNLTVVSFAIYMLWSFYSTLASDVEKKSLEAISELVAEMSVCARQYKENRCAPETRVPAMETVCNNWEKCMSRDTRRVQRSRVTVAMWGELLNSFVEPITWKTMFFSCIVVVGALVLSNLPFSHIRSRGQQPAVNHHYYGAVPPTPHRSLSNPDGQFWTPHQANQNLLEPAEGQGYIEGRGSPVKQLHFR